MLIELVALILLGGAVGVLSGIFGIGGNTIAIPILVYLFEYLFKFPDHLAMPMTIATSIITMLFALFASAYNHYKKGNIEWGLYKQIAPYMVIGSMSGAFLVKFVHAIILKKFFGVFLLLISIQLYFNKKNKPENLEIVKLPPVIMSIIALMMGCLSGMIGIGGAIILIPLFLALNYKPKQITGTVSACALTSGLAAAITILTSSRHVDTHIPYTIGLVYLPAIIIMAPAIFFAVKLGAQISIKANPSHLRLALILLLLLLSLLMLF